MATKEFASRLHNQLAFETAGSNLFLSPFSIQVALAMCARGAKGDTRQEMADLLGAPLADKDQDKLYHDLIRHINGDGSDRGFQLVTANALWGQDGSDFHVDYLKAVSDHYDGAFNVVDYINKPDEAVSTINAWVVEKTKEKIRDLIARDAIDEETRLILTNAIYFKGKWDSEFDKKLTKEENFSKTDLSTTKVQMMHRKDKYDYFEGDGFQAVDLPYKGEQLSMLVVLPKSASGLGPMEIRWHEEGLYSHVTSHLAEEDVILSLPRFKLETEFKLKPVLKALGADLAFSDDADFSAIGEEALKIAEVIHKAFVEVNEEGTEAAAATAVVMMRCTSAYRQPVPPKVFNADHPFLFFIRDRNTNVILFSGHVTNPA